MGTATIESDYLEIDDQDQYSKYIVSYFDWALTLVLGWANAKAVPYVSLFPVPDEIPGFMIIQDFDFEVKKDWILLSMDPTFLAGEYVPEDEIDANGHGIKTVF